MENSFFFPSLKKIKVSSTSTVDIVALKKKCYEALDDDINSPVALSYLFEGVKIVNSLIDGSEKTDAEGLQLLRELFNAFITEILGLTDESAGMSDEKLTSGLMKIIIDLRRDAKDKKDWAASDKIRSDLKNVGITLKDTKDGADWEKE